MDPQYDSFLIHPLSMYEHIKTKQKIKYTDSHHYLPWVLFADIDNNIVIYDINKKHVIRAFSLSQYLPDDVKIKGVKFFDCIDKNFVNNYEINPMLKVKGIPLNLRSSLIYLISDKFIFFYSYLLQNFVRYISNKDLNDSNIVYGDLYDYNHFLIVTEDGNLNKWSLLEWCLVKVYNAKQEFSKALMNLKVLNFTDENKLVVVATKNGKLFKVDLNAKTNAITKLDANGKASHDKEVYFIDFNPITNILITVSKNNIILYDMLNPSNYRKFSNFNFAGKELIKGLVPNLSTMFNKTSYFIFGKSKKIYLIELNFKDQSKIDSKNFTKSCHFSLDIDKLIFRKVNDDTIKVYQIVFLQHLYEYLVIASNKGLVIARFDSTYKAPVVALPLVPNLQSRLFYFYHLSKDNLILEKRLSTTYDRKNRLQIISDAKKINDDIFDNIKYTFNKFEIKFSFDFSLMSCLDSISKTYIIYKVEFDKNNNNSSISELKKISNGDALCLQWSPYCNNFAITNEHSPGNYILEVFSVVDRQTIKKVYDLKELLSFKIYSGHFLGVIVKKNGENLQVPMKYISDYSNEISKEAELNFYYWTEENKILLTIKEEPIDIISSDDLQYMIICFEDKFNIYKLNEFTGNLEKINSIHVRVVSGIIYENLIFVYLTEYGAYFQLLNKENCYPCKLFRQSDEVNMYNLKISKKFKENKTIYPNKPKQNNILYINGNLIFTCDFYGNVEASEINHILFKLIALIKKKNITGISALLGFLDKKLIEFVLMIFEHYFENNEAILRKIFTKEMIQVFELYNYFEFFIKDLAEMNPGKLEGVLEKYLIKAILANDPKKINDLYEMGKKYNLKMTTKAARTINKSVYLDSLMNKKRYIESYLFNVTSRVNNQNNDNILSMAVRELTTPKQE